MKHAVGRSFLSGRSAKCAALDAGIVCRIKEIVVLIFAHSAEKTGVIIRAEAGPRIVTAASAGDDVRN
jgi:hypothetical protein